MIRNSLVPDTLDTDTDTGSPEYILCILRSTYLWEHIFSLHLDLYDDVRKEMTHVAYMFEHQTNPGEFRHLSRNWRTIGHVRQDSNPCLTGRPRGKHYSKSLGRA
jgi:hypothetical protein